MQNSNNLKMAKMYLSNPHWVAECAIAWADGCIAVGDIRMAIDLLQHAKDLICGHRSARKAA